MGDHMKYVHCLNKISPVGLKQLPETYGLTDDLNQATGILVRSANMHEMVLPETVRVVARAGAGVNNIPLDALAKKGVVVFNTPGANRNAVKELVIAGMLIASRDIVGGIGWVKDNKQDPDIAKSVEKAKAQFGGTEILGKTIGIVGLGAIGLELARACIALGMKVIAVEPNMAQIDRLNIPEQMVIVQEKEDMLPYADFISLNLPLLPATKHMMNEAAFKMMKDGVVLLNFARDQLVDEDALLYALESHKVKTYVTDFPNEKTANMKGVIAIPHLGASTEEAEDNCAMMAVDHMIDYLEHGNITHSVNFPSAVLDRKGKVRLTMLMDKNVTEEMVLSTLNQEHIVQKVVKQNQNYQTIIMDFDQQPEQKQIEQLKQISEIYYIHVC
jgi:D-3-phosphoglycerate dehydrogenase